jgi:hypothetical protein
MAEEDDNKDNSGEASNNGQGESAPSFAIGETVKPAQTSYQKWNNYLSKPRNKVGLATLIAVVAYTGITVLLWCTSQKQLAVSRDTEQRQLRAYVGITDVEIPDGFFEDKIPTLNVSLKNFGLTPAYNVKMSFATNFGSFPDPGDLPAPQPTNATWVFNPSDVSSAPFDLPMPLTAADIAGMQNMSRPLYFYGRITYDDAFNRPHFANFRYAFGGKNMIKIHRMGEAGKGNEAD